MKQALQFIPYVLGIGLFLYFVLPYEAPKNTPVEEVITHTPEPVEPLVVDIDPQRIIELTNQERTSRGLPALETHPKLMASAQAKCEHMVEYGYFDHETPDGQDFWYFIEREGLFNTVVGENIANEYTSNKRFVAGWMNSQGHRDTILDTYYEYDHIGVGVCNLENPDNIQAVQHFAQIQ